MSSPTHPTGENARMASASRSLHIMVDDIRSVSAVLTGSSQPTACYVFAHGAGAGMNHPFMTAIADGLASRGFAALRFQFPYMEQGSKRPDRPQVAQATIRAAAAKAAELLPGLPLLAGGKSFGGRMSSQAQAEQPLPAVRGLIFLGFPLHPAGKPSEKRAVHLAGIEVPMLFIQGTRDPLAEMPLLERTVAILDGVAELVAVDQGDHSLHVPARSGRTDQDVLGDVTDRMAGWMRQVVASPTARSRSQ